MADSTQLPTAQQARDDDRRAAALRLPRRGDAGITEGEVPPGVAAIIDQDPDNLLDATKIQEHIVVTVPEWSPNQTPMDERASLFWARKDTPEAKILLESRVVPPNTTFPLVFNVQSKDYIQGQLELWYEGNTAFGNPIKSERLPITLDSVPPYHPESPVELTANTDVVTDAYLDTSGGTLTLTVPITYPDYADTDRVYFYWLRNVPTDPGQLPEPTVPVFALSEGVEIKVTREMLAAVGDGICYGVYALVDKAGNISRLSYWYAATVALGLLPDNLKPPFVPLAIDGMIDRLDAHTGVVVEIPAFDNWRTDDQVKVKWGDTQLADFQVGPTPVFPLRVPVPWTALEANYNYDAEDPLQKVTVGYQVTRVGLPFPAQPLTVEINVYLRVVGPDTPDPDPVNPNLPVLVARGESNQDNKLVESDADKPAKAHFLLFANAKEDDEITVHWGGLENLLHIYYVKDGDVPGTTPIEIEIPWNIIEEAGNSLELPVFYRITDAEQVNYQESSTTKVNVQAVPVHLPPPEFPDLVELEGGTMVLNCSSIKHDGVDYGIRVHVPPSKYLKAGMQVTLDWIVAENADGTGQIEGTELVENITVTADQERLGIDWFVKPYATKILPAYETAIKYGYTHLKYSTIVGELPVASAFVNEIIGLSSGSSSCSLP